MYDDPAGLRDCVGPGRAPAIQRWARLPKQPVQRLLKNQSPAFGREALRPGSEGDYSPSPQAGKGHLAQLSRGF